MQVRMGMLLCKGGILVEEKEKEAIKCKAAPNGARGVLLGQHAVGSRKHFLAFGGLRVGGKLTGTPPLGRRML